MLAVQVLMIPSMWKIAHFCLMDWIRHQQFQFHKAHSPFTDTLITPYINCLLLNSSLTPLSGCQKFSSTGLLNHYFSQWLKFSLMLWQHPWNSKGILHSREATMAHYMMLLHHLGSLITFRKSLSETFWKVPFVLLCHRFRGGLVKTSLILWPPPLMFLWPKNSILIASNMITWIQNVLDF